MKQPSPSKYPLEFYRQFPKVDLHRHLEGSLRFDTIRELARAHGLNLPATGKLRSMVQVQADEPLTFQNFLSKFATLRQIYRSPEIITRITREAIEDAAADNIRYLELRFTPAALSKVRGFGLDEVMGWVVAASHQAEQEFGVITRLIPSMNRHESPALAEEVVALATEYLGRGVVGIDLAGNEAEFSAEPFREVFKSARRQGLHIAVHAGEWGRGENVAEAIELLGAERIGHGIRVLENPRAADLALQNQTTFEVCLTSNYQSGAIAPNQPHPVLEMLSRGLNATLNSDDPGISQITLSGEYRLAIESLGFSLDMLVERIVAAAQAAFIPRSEREVLIRRIRRDYNQILTSRNI